LFANGQSLGKQASPEHFFYFEVPNAGETVLVAKAGECTDESMIRKVEVFNEEYRLKEKGAILNWFDITEPEGYFSLNDTMGSIMRSEGGRAILSGLMSQVMAGMSGGKAAGFEVNDGMLKMMEGFTLIRMANLMGTAGVTFTKEQLLALNAQLNQVPKN